MAKGKAKKKESDPVRGKSRPASGSIFERLEAWFGANNRKLFRITCIVTLLLSILHFNARISEGGDDSTYIYHGYKYAQDFFNHFFTFNAPLYPMFLALPIKLFGINLVVLKLISVIFYFFSVWFFYKAFERRVPYLVLYPVIFFLALNSYMHYFASQTYNEAFYLFLQSLFFYYFFRLWDKVKDKNDFQIRENWKLWTATGLLALALSLTKNLAVMVFPVVLLFFLLQKQWKTAITAAVVTLGIRGLFEVLKRVVWGDIAQLSSQGNILLLKDPYIESKGKEDLMGFVNRFLLNSEIYLSKRFFQIIGFMPETSTKIFGFLTIFIIVLIVIGLISIIRNKNKYLLFAWIFTGALTFVTFVALQIRWDQPRLILVHMPVIFLVIYFAFYMLFTRLRSGYWVYLLITGSISASVLISSGRKAAANVPVLAKNASGDIYYGFTPDWVNFLKISRWCADSLPENSVVVSRKSSMSFIYGKGKEFFPVNKVIFYDPATKQANPDSALAYFRENKVTHVIVASLRLDPRKKTQNVINTIHNVVQPIIKKYPERLKLVHQEGDMNSEPAFLYEIKTD
ncbi:MAG: hypothetical protein AB1458_12390 [Bacteroidota bacterium]